MPEHTIQLILSGMSLHRAAIFGAGTPFSEYTGGTDLRSGLAFIVVPLLAVMSSFQNLACSTSKGVGVRVINELLSGKIPFFLPEPRCVASKEGMWALIPNILLGSYSEEYG